jgi:hypothetical protein
MKKMHGWTWLVPGLISALAFAFAACDSPTNSGDTSGGDQLAQVSGLVVDALSAEPVQGVTVRLGDATATTGVNGVYIFKNVKPGDYPISFSKAGYKFDDGASTANANGYPDPLSATPALVTPTPGTIAVSPIAYKFYDPVAEYEALTAQFAALTTPNFPDPGGTSSNEQWTLTEGGVYVNGGGTAEVTYNNGVFEIKSIKLQKDYSYGVAVTPVTLTPLTGVISGKIIAVAEPVAATTNNFIDYPESVRAPLVNAQISINDGSNDYGPFATGTDGSFTADKLPVTGALTFKVAAIVQDGKTYIHNTTVPRLYQYSAGNTATTGLNAGVFTIPSPGLGPSEVKVGELWLFTTGDSAVVTEATIGSPAARLAVTDPIVFKFNVAMNPRTLPATLTLGTVALKAVWSDGDKTLTLTPAGYAPDSTSLRLPYGTAAGPTGTLAFTNLASAEGAVLYPSSSSYAVYTTVGLSLTGYAIVDAPASRAVILASGKVIELTFSEALSTLPGLTSAEWNSTAAAYKVDGAKLYVYPPAGTFTNAPLTFSVAAAADTSNTANETTAGIDITGLTFSKEADFALSLVNGSATITTVSIEQDGDIILDFNKALDPENTTATPPVPAPTAVLYYTNTGYSAVTATSTLAGSRSLKITPTNLLVSGNNMYNVYYQATSGGVKITGNIPVTVTAATNPTKSLASFSGLATDTTSYASGSSTVGVVYTPAAVPPFAQTYAIKRIEYVAGANNVWDGATAEGSYIVPKGSIAGTALVPVTNLNLPGTPPHTNAENIKFRLEGVSATGYAAASNVVSINFN